MADDSARRHRAIFCVVMMNLICILMKMIAMNIIYKMNALNNLITR